MLYTSGPAETGGLGGLGGLGGPGGARELDRLGGTWSLVSYAHLNLGIQTKDKKGKNGRFVILLNALAKQMEPAIE